MDLNFIQIILVIIVAFLAGVEGILDQFHFHQPVIACTLIGLVTGNLIPCLILGGTLQMIALGWANIGAAVAPDAALASVASALILVLLKYCISLIGFVYSMHPHKAPSPDFLLGRSENKSFNTEYSFSVWINSGYL